MKWILLLSNGDKIYTDEYPRMDWNDGCWHVVDIDGDQWNFRTDAFIG